MLPASLDEDEGTTLPRVVLVGQPNCGKSTLFNEVAGYRSIASNFPGATVSYTLSRVRFEGRTFELVDLPGIYSLTSLDPASTEGQRYLLTHRIDVIVNVIDASILSRSLELTLQLLDLEIPMVLCLNMIDEAERKGIQINEKTLSEALGIRVISTVASQGRGIRDLFLAVLDLFDRPVLGRHLRFGRDVERVIAGLARRLKEQAPDLPFSKHLLATKLLEGDRSFEKRLLERHPEWKSEIAFARRGLMRSHGKPAHEVINAERHALSMALFEKVVVIKKPKPTFKDRVDRYIMHPVLGYFLLIGILLGCFTAIFRLGNLVEGPLLDFFASFKALLLVPFDEGTLLSNLLASLIDGLAGVMAIVFPYLIPFLLLLSLLEDVGYLPRVAFLMDALMHRIGLHGTAVIPAVLGYGCNVPAVMATRILDSPRDRLIAGVISTQIPCAARMTIIYGLVGYYLGGMAALSLYGLNFLVIGLTGFVLSRLLPTDTPGMVLEIPVYHLPRLRSVWAKTWLRLREFLFIALPLFVAGSLFLTLVEFFGWISILNTLFRPVTLLLGLPKEVGVTLLFGVLRKELSLLMLFEALGTTHVLTVLTHGQIWVFTVFVVFYVPCLATIGVLGRQLGWKQALVIVVYTFFLALALGVAMRGLIALF